MFTQYDKAIAACVMGALSLIELYFGWGLTNVSEDVILTIISVITPVVVWLTPNKA